MKFVFAAFAAMALTAMVCASNDIPEDLLRAAGKLLTRPAWPFFTAGDAAPGLTPEDECQGRATHCKDCNTIVTCLPSGSNGKYEKVSEDACPSTRPYCVDNACAVSTNENCTVGTPSTFKCAKGVEGYLPDPKDCHLYHFCHDGQAYDYVCPDVNHMYNHEKAMCTLEGKSNKGSSKCPIIDCTGKALQFVTYTADANVYALCQSDETPLLAKCDDHFQFNVTTTSCERKCDHEGRQQDSSDPTKFYECTSVNGKTSKFSVIAGRCPPGTKFDSYTERCRA